MKFADIIQSNSWFSVKTILLQLYPKQKKNISGFEKVFNSLSQFKPLQTNISLQLIRVLSDDDIEEYIDVSGYLNDQIPSENDPGNSLALEFTPWEEWLGMEIDKQSLCDYLLEYLPIVVNPKLIIFPGRFVQRMSMPIAQ
jgi:hypothetical protein